MSTLLFHETSRTATLNIFKEIARVLKPGGVTAHFDGFQSRSYEPIIEFLGLWEVDNNNEKFLLTLKKMDVVDINARNGLTNARFDQSPFLTGLPEVKSKGKGYMAGGGFGDIDILVAEKGHAA